MSQMGGLGDDVSGLEVSCDLCRVAASNSELVSLQDTLDSDDSDNEGKHQ